MRDRGFSLVEALVGVRSADILSGRDRLVSGPFPLPGGAPGVRVGSSFPGRHGNSQRKAAATAMKRATSATTTSRAAII
jgi:hypothetical protein